MFIYPRFVLVFLTDVLPLRFLVAWKDPMYIAIGSYYGKGMSNNSIYIFEQLGRYFIISRGMLGL